MGAEIKQQVILLRLEFQGFFSQVYLMPALVYLQVAKFKPALGLGVFTFLLQPYPPQDCFGAGEELSH